MEFSGVHGTTICILPQCISKCFILRLYIQTAYTDYITHSPAVKTATSRVLKMAADSDESSSSSDEEALRRCQEAVWETKTDQHKGTACLFPSRQTETKIFADKVNVSNTTRRPNIAQVASSYSKLFPVIIEKNMLYQFWSFYTVFATQSVQSFKI